MQEHLALKTWLVGTLDTYAWQSVGNVPIGMGSHINTVAERPRPAHCVVVKLLFTALLLAITLRTIRTGLPSSSLKAAAGSMYAVILCSYVIRLVSVVSQYTKVLQLSWLVAKFIGANEEDVGVHLAMPCPNRQIGPPAVRFLSVRILRHASIRLLRPLDNQGYLLAR